MQGRRGPAAHKPLAPVGGALPPSGPAGTGRTRLAPPSTAPRRSRAALASAQQVPAGRRGRAGGAGRGRLRGGRRGRGQPGLDARPHRGGLLRRRQHDDPRRVDLLLRQGHGRPRVDHHLRPAPLRLAAAELSRARDREPRGRRRGPRQGPGAGGRQVGRRDRGVRRGDLRRAHGAPDLVRDPGAGPAAPRRRPAGLAGHGHPRRAGPHHRRATRADRSAGDRQRGRGRPLHGPAGG